MVKGDGAGLADGWSVGIAGEGGGDGEAKCCWRDAKTLLADGRVGFGGQCCEDGSLTEALRHQPMD